MGALRSLENEGDDQRKSDIPDALGLHLAMSTEFIPRLELFAHEGHLDDQGHARVGRIGQLEGMHADFEGFRRSIVGSIGVCQNILRRTVAIPDQQTLSQFSTEGVGDPEFLALERLSETNAEGWRWTGPRRFLAFDFRFFGHRLGRVLRRGSHLSRRPCRLRFGRRRRGTKGHDPNREGRCSSKPRPPRDLRQTQ